MKKRIIGIIAAVMMFTGIAIAGIPGNVTGEVTEIKGEMVTVKTSEGDMKTFHVDPKGTKKEGMIKIGVQVSADVNDKGHANWVKVVMNKK